MANDKIKFWPIRGTYDQIMKQPYGDGKIYFAYDTNQIFLDVNGENKCPMGSSSSSGILYAEADNDTLEKEIPEDDADDKYFMSIIALEEKSREKKLFVDDLILNSDGKFFRILEIDNANQRIYCQLLAVSGSGGGGGGTTYSNRSKIYKEDPESNYLINGRSSSIRVYAVSGKDPEDGSQLDTRLIVHWTLAEKTSTGLWSVYSQNTFTITASTPEEPIWEEFEFGTKARHSATNLLTMWVTGSASTESRSFEYEFYTSELTLERHPNFNNINTYSPDNVSIQCITSGDLEKIIFYYFTDADGNEVLLNKEGTVIGPGISEQRFNVPLSLATHGVHQVRIELYQYINGKADFTASAQPIQMEIAIKEVGNMLPIIWLGDYQDEYYQYDSIKIPYLVYDPNDSSPTVTFYKDTNKINEIIPQDLTKFSIWEIVNADLGMRNYYSIACGLEDLEVRREISFTVVEDPARANMKTITAGLKYAFDASGRSNGESATNRSTCIYGEGANAIKAKFENFNWYNNGWVTDSETGNTCLRISNGAIFSIPLKQTKFASTTAGEQSHTFEFQFKVRNVQDYANIVHNITRYKGNTEAKHGIVYNWSDNMAIIPIDGGQLVSVYYIFNHPECYLEWSEGKLFDNYDAFLQWYLPEVVAHTPEYQDPDQQIFPPSYDDLEYDHTEKLLNTNYAAGRYYDGQHGICIGAQDALFTNGGNTVNVSYVEDKLVNLSIVYYHGKPPEDGQEVGGNNKLMSIYLNGVLTGVERSTEQNEWTIGDDTTSIIFDSKYCDFDLYKVRVYSEALSLPSILTNYMVDLKDPIGYDLTQLARYNNTIDESQFDFEEMVKYNNNHPDGYIMPYIIFTTKPGDPTKDNTLPYSKAVKIEEAVKVEFVNTGLDRAYTTGELNQLAELAGMSIEEYYMHHCPSWIGDKITMQVQGTSSEFYPRRNYKIKTKSGDGNINMYMNRGPFTQKYISEDSAEKEETHLKFFYMDNDSVGTTKFTMKIDYMESSGSYNMGFANLVKNAYTHHPLYDYYTKGAFLTADTAYNEVSSYTDGKTYYYKNHKGNWKNTTDDELKIASAEDFNMGPVAYAASKNITKVLTDTSAPEYNKWYEAETVYAPASTPDYLDDYRTSVQGFPVLAFHEKTNELGERTSITFIGRYNMLLDKGSDEAFGFKPAEEVYQKFVTNSKGKPLKVSKVAECWEAENNSRGFCSFRDAKKDRTDDKFFDTGTLTSFGAPLVADYWEYRYHDKADSLDVIYELKDKLTSEKDAATVMSELGVDIMDNTSMPKPAGYKEAEYTKGMKDAGDAMLDLYSNWEKAVKWVWSTCLDVVPSAGVYVEKALGKEIYTPNTYYIFDEENSYTVTDPDTGEENYVYVYKLDDSLEFDDTQAYYKKVNTNYEPIKLCANNDLKYVSNTYYIFTSFGDYVLDPNSEFDPNETYYALEEAADMNGANPLPEPVTIRSHTYTHDTKEYRNAKFVYELTDHFNLEYLVTYFVMTEVFECYDSRGKNLMMASWGPQKQGGDYIWYPIFYDIDTQLGINNTGIPSFEYYVDATENGTFSTNDSVLWNNLYRNYRSSIIQKYRQLRGKNSSFDRLPNTPLASVANIESWYLADPKVTKSIAMRGERPLIAINLDEYYKYITITNSEVGYQDRNNKIPPAVDGGTYFYALQGDRSLSRQQFLTNRFNYIDSWLNQGNYERGGGNVVRGRIAANNPARQSDKWIEVKSGQAVPAGWTGLIEEDYWQDSAKTQKTHLFDGEYWINMEPVRNSYVTVGTDTANFPSLKYRNTDGPVKFEAPDLEQGVRTSPNYTEQLYYIYGTDQMKSLGDMSKLYWAEFQIDGAATKMTDLLLGYDGIDEEGNSYKNTGVNLYNIKAGSGMPLLKRVNLSNIEFNHSAPPFNFASCEKLEDFRATGSNIATLTFATGVALKKLYLPITLKKLELTEATKLNRIVTTKQVRNDLAGIDVEDGLYIPGLTYVAEGETPSSNIETINLTGDHLGYDSYKLLSSYHTARRTAPSSAITITGVNWTPYELVDEGTVYNEIDAQNNLYWLDDGHFGFKPFVYTTYNNWVLSIKNKELYKLNPDINGETIKNTDLLIALRDEANFKSASSSSATVPLITGTIYIDNDTPIGEKDIETELLSAYPGVKFFFKQVNKVPAAKYVILNDDGTYDILTRKSLGTNETFFPNPLNLISSKELDKYDTRLKYDFYGWSDKALSPAGVEALNDIEWYLNSKNNLIVTTNNPDSAALSQDQWYDNWSTQSIEEGVYDYIFYAVYGVHKYIMTFLNGDNETVAGELRIEADAFVPIPSCVPSKDESSLPFDQTYRFTGQWSLENGRVLTENAIKSNRNYTFYSEFRQQSVYDGVTDLNYFDFSKIVTYRENPDMPSFSTIPEGLVPISALRSEEITGVQIEIKDNISLSGKITLPTHAPSGQPIISIGKSFSSRTTAGTWSGGKDITHIFWHSENGQTPQLRYIDRYAFAGPTGSVRSKLQYVELPSTLRYIGEYAFATMKSLSADFTLPNGLIAIDQYAFQKAWGTNFNTIKIPGSVYGIGTRAFSDVNVTLDKFQFGDAQNPSNLTCLAQSNFLNDIVNNSEIFKLTNDINFTGVSVPNAFWFYGSSINQIKKFVQYFLTGSNMNANVAPLFANMAEQKHTFVYGSTSHNSYEEVLNW